MQRNRGKINDLSTSNRTRKQRGSVLLSPSEARRGLSAEAGTVLCLPSGYGVVRKSREAANCGRILTGLGREAQMNPEELQEYFEFDEYDYETQMTESRRRKNEGRRSPRTPEKD
jgi:hypothetical protein